MKVTNKFFYPLLLVLVLFALDKLVLLDAVQQCCTNYRINPFTTNLNYDFRQDKIIKEAQSEKKMIVLNLGTSRSMGYYQTPTIEHIQASNYLNKSEKEKLLKYQIINSSLPGSSIISSWVRLTEWLDHGFRPDMIWVEVSPFSFNKNSLWASFEIKHGIPWDLALRYAFDMPALHMKKVISSRIFQMSRFRLGSSVLSKSKWEIMFQKATHNIDVRPTGIPVFQGSMQGKENPQELMLYKYVSKEMKRTMFQNYRLDKNYQHYLMLIVKRARKEKIPIVIWTPPAHPVWQQVANKDVAKTGWIIEWQKMLQQIKKYDAKYLDFNQSSVLKCRYFVDPVHLDVRCFPEMAIRTLQAQN